MSEFKERKSDVYSVRDERDLNYDIMTDSLVSNQCAYSLATWVNPNSKMMATDLIHAYGCDKTNMKMSLPESSSVKYLEWSNAPLISSQIGMLTKEQSDLMGKRDEFGRPYVLRYQTIRVRDIPSDVGTTLKFPIERQGIISMKIYLPLSAKISRLLPFAFESVRYDPFEKTVTVYDSFPFACVLQLYCIKIWQYRPESVVKKAELDSVASIKKLYSGLYGYTFGDYKNLVAHNGRTQIANRTLSNMEFWTMRRVNEYRMGSVPDEKSWQKPMMINDSKLGTEAVAAPVAQMSETPVQQQQQQQSSLSTKTKNLAKKAQEAAKNLAKGAKKLMENTTDIVIKGLDSANSFLNTLNSTAEAANVTLSKAGDAVQSVANATNAALSGVNKLAETAKESVDKVVNHSNTLKKQQQQQQQQQQQKGTYVYADKSQYQYPSQNAHTKPSPTQSTIVSGDHTNPNQQESAKQVQPALR